MPAVATSQLQLAATQGELVGRLRGNRVVLNLLRAMSKCPNRNMAQGLWLCLHDADCRRLVCHELRPM